jgi:hypothetical protein
MTTEDDGIVISPKGMMCGGKLSLCADKGWPRECYRKHLLLAPNYHMIEIQAAEKTIARK